MRRLDVKHFHQGVRLSDPVVSWFVIIEDDLELDEFTQALDPIERDITPIRIADFLMAFGAGVQLALTVQELVLLGPLVVDGND